MGKSQYGFQWIFPETHPVSSLKKNGKALVTHQQLPDLLEGHEGQDLEAASSGLISWLLG